MFLILSVAPPSIACSITGATPISGGAWRVIRSPMYVCSMSTLTLSDFTGLVLAIADVSVSYFTGLVLAIANVSVDV